MFCYESAAAVVAMIGMLVTAATPQGEPTNDLSSNIGKRASFAGVDRNSPRLLLQTGHSARPDGVYADSAGRYLLSVSAADRSVILWDANTGIQLDRFLGSSGIS